MQTLPHRFESGSGVHVGVVKWYHATLPTSHRQSDSGHPHQCEYSEAVIMSSFQVEVRSSNLRTHTILSRLVYRQHAKLWTSNRGIVTSTESFVTEVLKVASLLCTERDSGQYRTVAPSEILSPERTHGNEELLLVA